MKKPQAHEPPSPPESAAQLIWFDPGTTTGVVVISLHESWLRGEGSAAPVAFKRAMLTRAHFQLGRDPKDAEELTTVSPEALAELARVNATSCVAEEMRSVEGGLDVIRRMPHAAWGYEDFRVRQMNGTEEFLSPARIGSTLRDVMLMGTSPRSPFKQLPSLGLSVENDQLMAAGLYRRGMPHATDAARHAFTFYRRARKDAKLRAAAWPYLYGAGRHEPGGSRV